jgi:hypothetical protein
MHDYLGRFRAGDAVPIVLPIPGVIPDESPRARVIVLGPGAPGTSWTLGLSKLPPFDGDLYRVMFHLRGMTTFVGRYVVRISWVVTSVERVATSSFDVIGGGDPGGAVIALHEVLRPPRRHVVAQLTAGVLVSGSNPRVST